MAKICKECGKNDYDVPVDCKEYVIFTQGVGDWCCTFRWNEKQTRSKIPAGVKSVRNVVTGEVKKINEARK